MQELHEYYFGDGTPILPSAEIVNKLFGFWPAQCMLNRLFANICASHWDPYDDGDGGHDENNMRQYSKAFLHMVVGQAACTRALVAEGTIGRGGCTCLNITKY